MEQPQVDTPAQQTTTVETVPATQSQTPPTQGSQQQTVAQNQPQNTEVTDQQLYYAQQQADPALYTQYQHQEAQQISLYLGLESQYLEEYSKITEGFDYVAYLKWRAENQKGNQFLAGVNGYDCVTVEKFVLDTLLHSAEKASSYTNYAATRDYYLQNLPYLSKYVEFATRTEQAINYVSYEIYANWKQARYIQGEELRSEIIQSSEVSYNENTFNMFIETEEELTLKAYREFFNSMESFQAEVQNEIDDEYDDFRKQLKDPNLYLLENYLTSLSGSTPNFQEFDEYCQMARSQFDEVYLQNQHQELLAKEHSKSTKPKQPKAEGVIITELDSDEEELLAGGVTGAGVEGEEQEEVQVEEADEDKLEEKLIESKRCECCKGDVYNCEGEACQLLGNCICVSPY